MISIILPYYDPGYQKKAMFTQLIQSIVKHASTDDYELIIVKDGTSYVDSHNTGLKNSTGEYIIVFNDDVLIEDNNFIEKFCQPNAIVGWQLGEFHLTGEKIPDGAGWAMSRKVFEQIGLLDEQFSEGINFEDTDYFLRAQELGFKFIDGGVNMKHYGNRTFSTYFNDVKWNKTYRNQALFYAKWKEKKGFT